MPSSRAAAIAAASAVLAVQSAFAAGKANTWALVGESGVSAQQLFRGSGGMVYILDKVENNPLQIDGHPVEYNPTNNSYRTQDVTTNTFCAGGNTLGNGTVAVFGGNKAVSYGGVNGIPGAAPYDNYNGGTAIRLFNPCTDGTCEYTGSQEANMQSERWYPSVETLQDGSLAIIGGMRDGGYVNTEYADNPTIEYFPSKGNETGLNILAETLPCNLYPLTWLLPSGNLLIQSNLGAEVFDWQNAVEHPLPNIPHAVRVYPASGATAMLPLTPANNWTATILFCGGTNLQPDQWETTPTWNVAAYPADNTCVSLKPDVSNVWVDEDDMFEGRSMGQFIILPDGRLFHLNGIATGTAGYGNTTWAIGQSYGNNPLLTAAYYDPSQPSGMRWQRPSSLGSMTVQRLYHSSATLQSDGSIFNAGSNPNADYIPSKGYVDSSGIEYTFPTEYRVETFYPDYYDATRPVVKGLPTTLGYGGDYFDFTLSAKSLSNNISNIDTVKVVVIRTGYSTHAMNFGMRMVQLNSTWTANRDGSGTIHSNQLPPNPSILAPGPALIYITVNGIPSTGVDIMVGNGQIGTQPIEDVPNLPGTIAQSGAVIITSSGSQSSDSQSLSSNSNTVKAATSAASPLFSAYSTFFIYPVIGLIGAVATFSV
ncbi:MAG: hypothetical protein CYPHOPRED_002864 [Cyphobasidiales sp. Tagirdzhanova-0007]|nr:MAG: hypothetical protein CYPHOPRED_002864 [Cyphobasidiales sp. Tagirdzhanova-0007]